MYPTTFPRNHWYVAGHGRDLGRELTSRWILGDPICFYRREDGAPVALVDRCIHRQMPLTLGRLKGNNVECAYHGIVFGDDGRALRIPSQKQVPRACRVHRYPLVESGGLLWIWMGDPERADQASIPSHSWLSAPGWTTVRGTMRGDARAQLINENLVDLSHVTFLHPETVGTAEVAEAPASTEYHERSVRVVRSMSNVPNPALFEKVMGLIGLVDREQVAEFIAPGFHTTHVVVKPVGVDASSDSVFRHKVVHCITPERAKSYHYFWAVARNYRLDDEEVSAIWERGVDVVIRQDVGATEAIERVISACEPGYPVEMNLKIDAGALRARRLIEMMVAAEANGSEPAPSTDGAVVVEPPAELT